MVAENDGGKRHTATFKADVISRMSSLIHGHTLFWRITRTVLIVEPYKLYNHGNNLPIRIGHVTRDTAHAPWWLQTHCQWHPVGDVRTHNSRTDSRRIFKHGRGVRGWSRDHNQGQPRLTKVKRWIVEDGYVTYQQPERYNKATDRINFKLHVDHREIRNTWHTFYVSRSSKPEVEMWRTFSLSNAKINRKCHRIAEITLSVRKSGSTNRMPMSEVSLKVVMSCMRVCRK